MTGGGGRDWKSDSAGQDIGKEAAKATGASSYEADANSFLQDVVSSYNNRDAEAIQGHLDVLQRAIEKDIDGLTDVLFGGSVKKHTYVDGLSDVDVLLVVNQSSLAETSPQAVLDYLEGRIRERLPDTEVKSGTLAITVSYSDGIEIQLLPALKTQTGVRIANQDGSDWSSVVRPQEFAGKLTQVNRECGSRVVPVIKLFKVLQSSLPGNSQLKGYHVESLAIEAFRDYQGRQTYKDMLQHFAQVAASRVQTPLADTTGQSRHVDDYLGASGSSARVRTSKALNRIAKKLATADQRGTVDTLRDLFGE